MAHMEPVRLYRVIREIPEIGARPDDIILVRPGRHSPFLLMRDLPLALLPIVVSRSCVQLREATPEEAELCRDACPVRRGRLRLVE